VGESAHARENRGSERERASEKKRRKREGEREGGRERERKEEAGTEHESKENESALSRSCAHCKARAVTLIALTQ